MRGSGYGHGTSGHPDSMLFWALVAMTYLVLLGGGHVAGRHLAQRDRGGRGGGGRSPQPEPSPDPFPGLAWEPLGSEFDRALLPAAFSEQPAEARR